MLVQEMHIEVERQVQQLQTNKNRKLYSEEIDWELNKAQLEIIRDEVDPILSDGVPFTFDIHKLRKVDSLITYDKPLFIFNNNSQVLAFAPSNCMYPLDAQGMLLLPCDPYFSDSTKTVTLYLEALAVPRDVTGPLYYPNFTLLYDDKVILTHPGIKSLAAYFELVSLVVDKIQSLGFDCFYEKGQIPDLDGDNTFVIQSTSPLKKFKINYGVSGLISQSALYLKEANTSEALTKMYPINIYKPQLKRFMEGDPFYQAYKRNAYLFYHPTDSMKLYIDQSGILTSLELTYIRKPRKINLLLNISSELSDTVQQEICNRAAKNILKFSGNQLYQTVAQERES